MEKVLQRFLNSKPLKQSTHYSYFVVIRKHFSDWLNKPLTEITPLMIETRHKEISINYKTGANTAMRYLKTAYNYPTGT